MVVRGAGQQPCTEETDGDAEAESPGQRASSGQFVCLLVNPPSLGVNVCLRSVQPEEPSLNVSRAGLGYCVSEWPHRPCLGPSFPLFPLWVRVGVTGNP